MLVGNLLSAVITPSCGRKLVTNPVARQSRQPW